MEILEIDSKIDNWEAIPDYTNDDLKIGERPGFLLFPKHPEFKSIFRIVTDFHFTTENTDFILDTTTTCLLVFDMESNKPTLSQLYDLYCSAKSNAMQKINQRLSEDGYPFEGLALPMPFEAVKDLLIATLQAAYPDN